MHDKNTVEQAVQFHIKKALMTEASLLTRVIDAVAQQAGTVWFFVLHVIFFFLWISVNTGWIPLAPIFDPFPFGFLTMIVSLEATFLSIIVLMSQNRASEVANLREKIDFEIGIRAENEITKILNMLDTIQKSLGIDSQLDTELQEMKQKTDLRKIEESIEGRN
jgi:uncharacterized membrane protein